MAGQRMCAGGAALALAAVLALGAACRPAGEPLDLLPLLRQGVPVPRSDLADLSRGNRQLADPQLEFWQPLPATPGSGWGAALRGWRPLGERSTLTLRRRTRGAADLLLELHRRPAGVEPGGSPAAEPLAVEVVVDGDLVGRLTLEEGPARGRYPLPAGTAGATARIELRFDPPIRQPATGPQEIALRTIGLVASGAEPPEPERMLRFDDAGQSLRFLEPGWLVTPLRLPADATRIRFRVTSGGGASGPEPRLDLFALDAAGERIALTRPIRGGGEVRAELDSLAGRPIFLVFEAAFEAGAGPRITRPVIETAPRGRSAQSPADEPEQRMMPDVLLVVLDAARGDRFASAERRRAVAPGLDRLAREALSFTRAYAECPTTSCSIPNLITGRSFLPTGDVWRSPPLAEEVTTLAEYLRRAGYRTVGYSASPSNSLRRGCGQGFDRFVELWGADHPHHGPYGMSELAVRAIREQPDDRPLYLQLHYLPPHEPYNPPPRFDLFTDPDYRGPIGPFTSLRPYKEGLKELAGDDLAQLIGLYDGNLRLADDALGRVIAALEERGRWRDTLLVVTSDHGEAFMEHGRWGHNTLLYDEMLHVPLILRLPGGALPPTVEPQRPVGLGDVVPTVLGRLGLSADESVDGVDLLAPDRGPRTLFHRTADLKWPQLAVRSGRWKLIAWPRHMGQELFDLDADPHERENLAADRPLLYAGLGTLIRQHLHRTLLRAPGESLAPTEEEAEALRALGYLD